MIVGFIFFMNTPSVYSGPTTRTQKKQFFLLAILEIILVIGLIKIPFVDVFYNLKMPSLYSVIELIPLIALYALVQYGLVRWFFLKALSNPPLEG